jgi:hypothetical protein
MNITPLWLPAMRRCQHARSYGTSVFSTVREPSTASSSAIFAREAARCSSTQAFASSPPVSPDQIWRWSFSPLNATLCFMLVAKF